MASKSKTGGSSFAASWSANFTAMVLVVPGIGLYVYILYIIVSKLVYPATFFPFTQTYTNAQESLDRPAIWSALVKNGLLLCVFAIQHSLMASQRLKGFFEDIGLPVIARPVYICCTCFTINVIHYFWQPLPSLTLWQLSEEDRNLILVLLITHLLCWVLIASSVFTIDYLELMGFKQIYYSFHGFENPMLYKSAEQRQLLSHNRHPILLAPSLILWAVPVMTYDRFLVAVMLPLYLGLGTVIDKLDVAYVSEQFSMKKRQLLAN